MLRGNISRCASRTARAFSTTGTTTPPPGPPSSIPIEFKAFAAFLAVAGSTVLALSYREVTPKYHRPSARGALHGLSDVDRAVRAAENISRAARFGTFATVDLNGFPSQRTMDTASAADGLTEVYLGTNKHSRKIAELKAAGGKCSLSFFDQRGPGYIQLVARIPTLAPSALFSAAAPAALLPFSHFGALSLEECKGRVSGEHSRLATLMKLLSDCTCVSPFQGTAEVIDDEAQKKAKFRPEWYGFYPEGPTKEGRFVMLRIVPQRMEVVSPPDGVAGGENEWRPVVLVRSDNGWQLAPKPAEEEMQRLRGGFDVHGKRLPEAAPAAAASGKGR